MALCVATTKEGTPCQLPVREGRKYCHVHAKQRRKRLLVGISSIAGIIIAVFTIFGNLAEIAQLFEIKPSKFLHSEPPSTQSPKPQPMIKKEIQEILNKFMPNVYQMFEKHRLIYRSEDDDKRRELKNWHAELNFQSLPSPARDDLEAYRTALIEFLDNPPTDRFKRGWKIGELGTRFLPILVDFEIDGRRAKQDGYTEMAETIDALLNLGKGIFLKTQMPENVRPVTRLFIEYLMIYKAMFEAPKRPIEVQIALLAMQPDQLNNLIERNEFVALDSSLLMCSWSITYRDADLEVNKARPLSSLLRIVAQFNITEEEIRKAGGENLIETIRMMHNLLRKSGTKINR